MFFTLFILTIIIGLGVAVVVQTILLANFHNKNQQLNEENEKYSPIINIEQRAQEIIPETKEKVNQTLKDISDKKAQANQQAETIVSQARESYTKIINDANTIRTQAYTEAEAILNQARAGATKCRVCHVEAVEHVKKELGALQRKIEGYGREFLIPGIGLLDELAVDFGHTEAGQQLKAARTKVREMFKTREAAACDYAEKNRQDTATDFVADAFNGKVEEILSRVRHDNYGKLAQEIRDAAVLVNKNGEAYHSLC